MLSFVLLTTDCTGNVSPNNMTITLNPDAIFEIILEISYCQSIEISLNQFPTILSHTQN